MQLLTAAKKTLASSDLGRSDSQLSTDEDSQTQPNESETETAQAASPLPIRKRSSDITEDYKHSNKRFSNHHGGKSKPSSSLAQQVSGKRASSTRPSGTKRFTLWQASNLSGSTGTRARVFSYLTSIRRKLLERHSSESWTDILTPLQSKEALSQLDGVWSAFYRTSTSAQDGTMQSSDDSQGEDSSISDDDFSHQPKTPIPSSRSVSSKRTTAENLRPHRNSTTSATRRYFMDEEAQCSEISEGESLGSEDTITSSDDSTIRIYNSD